MIGFFQDVARSLAADWRPAVEIAVIAAILYLIFRFMRGTRGAAVLRGTFFVLFAALAVLVLFAHAAGLARLVWVLERLIALAVVGVLVVFQPEIRRGLIRSGGGRLVSLFSRAEHATADEVVEAAAALSKEKAGAVIAVERASPLSSYARGGVRLDAELSSELLASLFAAGSPLCDGAAIVRARRVAAAGCLLPLTENPEAAKTLGTRHRGAIGLTEQTDAAAVVISGGSGKLALAFRGELTQDLSVEELRARLRELCPEAEPAAG
jgi:diadenylate cyclase